MKLLDVLAVALRITVLGEALFIALISILAMESGALVFRYAGF